MWWEWELQEKMCVDGTKASWTGIGVQYEATL
jgi:hypothetical protein